MFRLVASLVAALAIAGPAVAEDFEVGDLTITEIKMIKPFDKARAAGGFFDISNAGEVDDMLIGARTDSFMAEIHESREENGVMRMIHLDAITIPAGRTVQFQRGGLHVMVMGLQPGDLNVGEEIDVTLSFDRAGDVVVTFPVVDNMGGMEGHEGHVTN